MGDLLRAEQRAEELEALQCIYEGAVHQREPVWGQPTLGVVVQLAVCAAELRVTLPPRYPLEPPQLSLVDCAGVSADDRRTLEAALRRKAQEKKGEAAIFDLVELVKESLQLLEDGLPNDESFYDAMLRRQAVAEEEARAEEQAEAQAAQRLQQQRSHELEEAIRADRRQKQKHLEARRQSRTATAPAGASSGSDSGSGSGEDGGFTGDAGSTSLTDTDREYASPERRVAAALALLDEGDESSESSASGSDLDLDDDDDDVPPDTASRYEKEFRELAPLGSGGFGEVVKAQNRVDKRLYAIKKIKLDDPSIKRKLLREVSTLASMTHQHIVRYYQAWWEGGEETSGSDSSGSGSGSDSGSEGEDDDEDDDDDDGAGDSMWMSSQTSVSERNARRRRRRRQRGPSMGEHPEEAAPGHVEQLLGGNYWDPMAELNAALDSSSSDSGSDGGGEEEVADEQEEEEEEEEQPARPRWREDLYLYIQMEYCTGQTLRELIDAGELWQDEERIWQLSRQIIEALVYTHSKGVIHRDLKPPNVFLDDKGNVRLGDFGLATTKRRAREDDAQQTTPAAVVVPPADDTSLSQVDLSGADDSITAGVGTTFYRAPEQEEGQGYDESADMYSLGVIFYEMWRPPFTTGMERYEYLSELRQSASVPREHAQQMPAKVVELVENLVRHGAADRPTASQLAGSTLLPPRIEVEDDYLRDALAILAKTDRRSAFYPKLMNHLFLQEPDAHLEHTYFFGPQRKAAELRVRERVCQAMRGVFERHGAQAWSTPLLHPMRGFHHAPGSGAAGAGSCSLIDEAGVCVQLSTDLAEPWVRHVVRQGITLHKRYAVDRIFWKRLVNAAAEEDDDDSADVAAGGRRGQQRRQRRRRQQRLQKKTSSSLDVAWHPRELVEADFDIVWEHEAGGAAAHVLEAETVMTLVEVLTPFRAHLGRWCLRLTDASLSQGLVELMGVPPSRRHELLLLLSSACRGLSSRQWRKQLARMELRKRTEAAVEALFALSRLGSDPAEVVAALRALLEQPHMRPPAAGSAPAGKERKRARLAAARQRALRGVEALARLLGELAHQGVMPRRAKDVAAAATAAAAAAAAEAAGPVPPHPEQDDEGGALHLPAFVQIDLGLAELQKGNYMSGLAFTGEVVPVAAAHSSEVGGKKDVIAEGGRFDSLFQSFGRAGLCGVGLRLAVDKVTRCVFTADALLARPQRVQPGVADVLVASLRADGAARDRLTVARQLWAAGVRAEYLHPPGASLTMLQEQCASRSIPFLVLLKRHSLQRGQVRLHWVMARGQPDKTVALADLPRVVANDAGDESGAAGDGGGGHGHGHGHGGGGGDEDGKHGDDGHPPGGPGPADFNVRVEFLSTSTQQRPSQAKGGKGDKGGKEFRATPAEERVRRRVHSAVEALAFGGSTALAVDASLAAIRELGSAYMFEGSEACEAVLARHQRARRQLRALLDSLSALSAAATPGGRGAKAALVYSTVDDRCDLVSLAGARGATAAVPPSPPARVGKSKSRSRRGGR